MKIILASKFGFCYGVKRAIQIAENAYSMGSNTVTLGPLINNPQMLNHLAVRGVGYVDDIEDIDSGTVIIRSHGVGPTCYNRADEKKLKIIDATCPFVLRAQQDAHRLIAAGKKVIIFGEKNHPEVRSISEWAMGKAIVAESPEDLQDLSPMDEVSIVSQTTFSEETFQQMLGPVSYTHLRAHETTE